MGLDALTHRHDGSVLRPLTPEDWDEWVGATRTRNYVKGDPILDWLDLHGDANGFQRDMDSPGYDARTDFTPFIFEQGRRFEAAVVDLLSESYPVSTVAEGRGDARDLRKARDTFAAMEGGAPIIHQGVLLDPEHLMYGVPDLLVRSDVLAELFPETLGSSEAAHAAPDLSDAQWHYRVVDVKFRTLGLLAAGGVDNSGSAPTYKVQLFVYNRALGRVQGFEPPTSYLLGRAWQQSNARGSGSLERLGAVSQAGTVANKRPISQVADAAASWVRRVRAEGASWRVLPEPSVPELYPNSSNQEDGPWHNVKKQIADELEDLTQLWQVSAPGRRKAHDAGVRRWTDPGLTPEVVGVTGDRRQLVLTDLLGINTTNAGPPVHPQRIRAARAQWHETPALEFYVDFETVSDLADDFSRMPEKGGQPLIFMIGCGHVEAGGWSFETFVVEDLTEDQEGGIVQRWQSHMESVRRRLAPSTPAPHVIHWSHAEKSRLKDDYNSAWERHGRPEWPSLNWFDFLQNVMREEPVVVRGALAFGLKNVARAMHSHGLIETRWSDGLSDGMGAMVGAWRCQKEARRLGKPMHDIDLMAEIVRYNEVDCKVMMEIVGYLRRNH